MAINIISFKQNQVKKIASDIASGVVSRHWADGRKMTYLVTTRATGADAPNVETLKAEGVLMFKDNPEQEIIANDTALDIYAYCDDGGAPGDTGKLVVWS